MMAPAPTRAEGLAARLPALRGRISEQADLSRVTWFRVGGPAEVLFKPADRDDLLAFLGDRPSGVPVTLLGVGSNLLVRDGGVPGVVIRLGRPFAEIAAEGAEVVCGAAALDYNVAKVAQSAGIAGLEFLCGVPGTIGGALRMNAGAYRREIGDVLVWAEAATPDGELRRLTPDEMGLSYRHCAVPEDWIFLGARLRGEPGERAAIATRMTEIQQAREETQPIRNRTGGSTFKNPPGAKAWELIDQAGCRGLTHGKAMVSEKHCNFLINTGGATAAELEELGEMVRQRVRAHSGVALEWEIRRVGVPAPNGKPDEAAA